MTAEEQAYARWCAEHDAHAFYTWRKWLAVRDRVLAIDKHECQMCRRKYKRYRPADTVHHVNRFKDRPDIALDIYYRNQKTHAEERNLISLCHDCHEEVHGYRKRTAPTDPLTDERWD